MTFPYKPAEVCIKFNLTQAQLDALKPKLKRNAHYRQIGKHIGYSDAGLTKIATLLAPPEVSDRHQVDEVQHVVDPTVTVVKPGPIPARVLGHCPNRARVWALVNSKRVSVYVGLRKAPPRPGSVIMVRDFENGYEAVR